MGVRDRHRDRRLEHASGESAATMVVGVGASAGGLAALRTFFEHVPEDSGLAFVVVVHLSPEHESHLPGLLQQHLQMPVRQVTETVLLEPEHVYVIPPGANLDTIDTHLRLSELERQRAQRAPIDHFFRTLASSHDGKAVGVILTGTGSDGALGVREIKERGGLTVVQDPGEAEYDGMPQSAIATGMVDLVLPVAGIAEAIVRFARTRPRLPLAAEGEELDAENRRLLLNLFAQVRARTGRDFSPYKRSTLLRRIQRRMQLAQVEQLDAYLERLHEDGEEVRALADDLLITVTSFFRDPEVWKHLEAEVVPQLFVGKEAQDSVRAWSVGCATGEEAYSIAMLLAEEAARRAAPPRIQIFASDLHDHSLAAARQGLYPGEIESDVSPERLRRFFHRENGGYRVRKELRELMVFAPHDVLSDPPFSRLDLVVCRNVLIYLQRDIQKDVLEIFHYALRPDAFLALGPSETVEGTELFRTESKRLSIYRKRNVPVPELRLPVFPVTRPRPVGLASLEGVTEPIAYATLHTRIFERYGPASMLVGPDDRVVHLSEHAGRYLVHPGGELTASAFKLVRDDVRFELRAMLQAARSRGEPVRSRPLPITVDGRPRSLVLDVRPTAIREHEGYALVIFDEREEGAEPAPPVSAPGDVVATAVEADLALTRQRLQGLLEEFEATQEERQASQEELQSSNEELRSTLEELETSKEELQSINEELQTINQENRRKVEELGRLSSDLQNLLSSTDIATLFLDRELRIQRFTPRVVELFNVRPIDSGRPLADLTHRLVYDEMLEDAAAVLERLVPIEREVRDESGRWYLSRVLPYRSADDRIEGVVLTLVDITERKAAQEERDRFFALPLDLLAIAAGDGDRWVQVNPGMSRVLGWSEAELLAAPVSALICPGAQNGPDGDGPAPRQRLLERPVRCKDGSERWIEWQIERVSEQGLTYFAGRDVTERHHGEAALRQSEARLRAIADLVPDLLWRGDAGGRATWYNERWLTYTGLTLEQSSDFGWLETVHPADRDRVFARFQDAIEAGEAVRHELRFRRGDGSYRWFLVQAQPVRDETGQITQWFGAATDIDEQRTALEAEQSARAEADASRREADQARDAAERASRAKSQFLSTMSHELRTPLTAVIGLSDLLGTEVVGPMTERQKDMLGRIKASAWHLVTIIDEILTFSRTDAGKAEVQLEVVDVAEIVAGVAGMLRPESEARGLELVVLGTDQPLPAITDGGKLRQIIVNLVGNAIKYTEQGRVDVTLEADEAEIRTHVGDTGVGIPCERLDEIFEPFVQLERPPQGRGGGAGLGLAICRRLARLLGGDVSVESTPGQGSTFTLRLPRRQVPPD